MFEALHDVLYCPTVDAEKIHWLGKAGPAASCVIATVAVCVRSVEVKVTVAGARFGLRVHIGRDADLLDVGAFRARSERHVGSGR